MSWLLTSKELTPLFIPPGYAGGDEVEAGFRLLKVSGIRGYLSILRIFWLQCTPKSATDWLIWTGIYAAVIFILTVTGNAGKFSLLIFLGGFAIFIPPIVNCFLQANSKYRWAINYCKMVVNAGNTGDRIDEAAMRAIVRCYQVNNLREFKEALTRHRLSTTGNTISVKQP